MSITTHFYPHSSIPFAVRSLTSIIPPFYPLQTIQKKFSRITGAKVTVFTSSGRSALHSLLESYSFAPKSEIIIQPFTCSVVPSAIIDAKLTPVYCDIDPKTLTLNPKHLLDLISANTRAVIFQRTFGSQVHLKKIADICKRKKLTLIVDSAHIVDNQSSNYPTIYSFGRSKWLTANLGGAVSLSDPLQAQKIVDIESSKKHFTLSYIFARFLEPLVVEIFVKPFLSLGVGQAIHFALSQIKLLSKEVDVSELHGHLGHLNSYQFPLQSLKLLDFALTNYDSNFQTRTKNVSLYLHQLPPSVLLPGFQQILPFTYYPIVVPDPQSLYQYAKSKNIYLGNWYYPTISPPGTQNHLLKYTPGSCPSALSVSEQIVNLPLHLSPDSTQKIATTINSFFKQ